MTSIGLVFPPNHPPMEHDESMGGYIMRLAELNRYPRREWLFQSRKEFKPGAHAYLKQVLKNTPWSRANSNHADHAFISHIAKKGHRITRRARYCVCCLREGPYLRILWQDKHYCVCLKHHCWMIDRCYSCSKQLDSMIDGVTKCSCGANLRKAVPEYAHNRVVELVAFSMGHDATVGQSYLSDDIHTLNIERRRDFVTFLAKWTGLQWNRPRKAGSTGFRSMVEAKKDYIAASAVFSGIDGLNSLLQILCNLTFVHHVGSARQVASSAFACDFEQRFPESLFKDVQAHVVEHIHTLCPTRIDNRAKVLAEKEKEPHNWVSRREARQRSGLSKNQLSKLISNGRANLHHLGPGFTNNFLISYRDIDNHLNGLSSVMFWHEVATELGIRNNQVKMLHIANMLGEPKFINRKKKDSLHFLHEKVMELKLWFQTPSAAPTVDLLPIGELLELHHGYDPQLFLHLMRALFADMLPLRGAARDTSILSACVSLADFQEWFGNHYDGPKPLPIEEYSKNVDVTIQVLLKMQRDGLFTLQTVDKRSLFVTPESLADFNKQYASGTRLAAHISEYVRDLVADLDAKNIFPIDETGNFTMHGRLYQRHEIAPLLDFNLTVFEKKAWLKQHASFRTWLPNSKKARQRTLDLPDFNCDICGCSPNASNDAALHPSSTRRSSKATRGRFRRTARQHQMTEALPL